MKNVMKLAAAVLVSASVLASPAFAAREGRTDISGTLYNTTTIDGTNRTKAERGGDAKSTVGAVYDSKISGYADNSTYISGFNSVKAEGRGAEAKGKVGVIAHTDVSGDLYNYTSIYGRNTVNAEGRDSKACGSVGTVGTHC